MEAFVLQHQIIAYCISITVMLALYAWAYFHIELPKKRKIAAELLELERWNVHWNETRKWLAEFPDSADALDYLKAKAEGAGGTDISYTRSAMRARRVPDRRAQDGKWPTLHAGLAEFVPPRPGLTAQAAAADEAQFRVRYQHLGAECHGGDPS